MGEEREQLVLAERADLVARPEPHGSPHLGPQIEGIPESSPTT
jgi:hypothetical protein